MKTLSKLAIASTLLIGQAATAGLIINEVNLGSSDYVEFFNYGLDTIDLAGYSVDINDSGRTNFQYLFPSISLAANSTVIVVAEDPNSGELSSNNIPFFYTRDLSLTIRDNSNTVIDFWAHGSPVYNAPAGVSFSPTGLSLINSDTNLTTYQRQAVNGSGNTYFGSDWTIAAASRGTQNAGQVFYTGTTPAEVPEPTSLALMGIGMLAAFSGVRRKRVS